MLNLNIVILFVAVLCFSRGGWRIGEAALRYLLVEIPSVLGCFDRVSSALPNQRAMYCAQTGQYSVLDINATVERSGEDSKL